ncbi:MAG: endonuclease/exonuclease/phosphatase family protein, partial [Planctomycetes bacterium]|nr:endonuclease/exonuclease/phosphatase family protein [Planctomycetota bacterium]
AAAEISFASWNVENLFDDVEDSFYDKELLQWWNTQLYQKKLDRLANVIGKMNGGKGPDVLALIEIENRKVLLDLVKRLPHPESYTIVHFDGRASRGIEVALITRLKVKSKSTHFVFHGIRDVLRVDLEKNGHVLTVLVNHWKSRFGGTLQTSDVRTINASRTYQLYYEIVRKNKNADVLICGDFNDGIDNISLKDILNARESRLKVERQKLRKSLYNCTTEIRGKDKGTYYYDYSWRFLDQVIISRGLLTDANDGGGFLYKPGSLKIFNPQGKLIRKGAPWRFGGKSTSDQSRGYSDHLPLVATFVVPD